MNEHKRAHSEKASEKEQYPLTRSTETRQFAKTQSKHPTEWHANMYVYTHTVRRNTLLRYEATYLGRLNNRVKLKGDRFMLVITMTQLKLCNLFKLNEGTTETNSPLLWVYGIIFMANQELGLCMNF